MARALLISRTTLWSKEARVTLEKYATIRDEKLDHRVRILLVCYPHCGSCVACCIHRECMFKGTVLETVSRELIQSVVNPVGENQYGGHFVTKHNDIKQ